MEGKVSGEEQGRDGVFAGKVVIITGSSAGIGRNTAIEFGNEGAKLVIHGQNEQRLETTARELVQGGVPPADILQVIGSLEDSTTAEKLVTETIAKFGKIDVLINNAGSVMKAGEEDPLAQFDYLYRTKGSIVNVSSVSSIRAYPTLTLYGALKAALDHITRNDALRLGPKGIRVNALSPGLTRTEVITRHEGLDQAKFEQYAIDNVPLGRIGHVAEMSAVIKFLASDTASYINGAIVVVDGGVSLHTNPLVL